MGSRSWKRAQSAREFEFTTLSLFSQPCFFFGLSAIQNGFDGRAGKRMDDGCRNDNGSDPARLRQVRFGQVCQVNGCPVFCPAGIGLRRTG